MTLEEQAERAAANAVCTRCGALMVQRRLTNQLITGTWRWVGEKSGHFNLCSDCGPDFRDFLKGVR